MNEQICCWSNRAEDVAYHDTRWCRPIHEEKELFAMLSLECFSVGLSWDLILRKEKALREAFYGFDPKKLASLGEGDVPAILAAPGMIKSERKIRATLSNARAFLKVEEEFGSFDSYLWGFTKGKTVVHHPQNKKQFLSQNALSRRVSKDLIRRGFSFVGPTIVYSYLQSVGILNDHVEGCPYKYSSLIQGKRVAGVLLPIFSLPGRYGIGSLGASAKSFVDFLSASGVSLWQMLPLGVTSYGDSPYQSFSSSGLNYYFLDLDTLAEQGLLSQEELDEEATRYPNPHRVDYGALYQHRIPLLKKAFSRFDRENPRFKEYVASDRANDFAFYLGMKEIHHGLPWKEWPEGQSVYSKGLEDSFRAAHEDLYLFYVWTQFEFEREYFALKRYANDRGIVLMGDMPIYVAYDSVEAYEHHELFQMDEEGNPKFVAGCPPDFFSPTGQLWGNPCWDWEAQAKDNYAFFSKRISDNLRYFDLLRIDHFRGFAGYYAIPYGDKDATRGHWVEGPGIRLFQDKKNLPIVAEDLGFLTPDVKELLQETGYPGMRVLEFGLDDDPKTDGNPLNWIKHCLVYTGTHDNEPLMSFFASMKEEDLQKAKSTMEKGFAKFHAEEGDVSDPIALTHQAVRLCYLGPSELAIVPYHDVLALGAEARLNEPSSLSGKNWTYRMEEKDFGEEPLSFLREIIAESGRGI